MESNRSFLANSIKSLSGAIEIKHFPTMNRVIDHNTNLKFFYEEHFKNKILIRMEELHQRNCGWSLFQKLQLKVNFSHYSPISSGISDIQIAKFIQSTKGVLNIKNKDDCYLL